MAAAVVCFCLVAGAGTRLAIAWQAANVAMEALAGIHGDAPLAEQRLAAAAPARAIESVTWKLERNLGWPYMGIDVSPALRKQLLSPETENLQKKRVCRPRVQRVIRDCVFSTGRFVDRRMTDTVVIGLPGYCLFLLTAKDFLESNDMDWPGGSPHDSEVSLCFAIFSEPFQATIRISICD